MAVLQVFIKLICSTLKIKGDSSMLVKEWLDLWIEDYGKGNIKRSTVRIYKGYVRNYIAPKIGKLELKDLKAPMLQKIYDETIKEKGISAKTLRNINSMFHRSLKKAVREEIIDKNPSDYVELPKVINKEIQILNDDDEDKLKNAIKDEYFGVGILVVLYTGLRLGELLGLKWSNIDLDNRILKVTHTLSREVIISDSISGRKTCLILQEPKTKSSKREIPLNQILIKELQIFKQKQQEKYGNDINLNQDFMLSKKYMKPIDLRCYQNFFQKILDKAKIKHVSFHSLRHSFATKAIKTGVSDTVTSKLLGHTSVPMSLNTYTHFSSEMARELIDRL